MNRHQRDHCEKKLHKCDVCKKAFFQAGKLERHQLKVHGGKKGFKCSKCDYSSVWKPKLKRHLIIHSVDKPYKCLICNYACKRKYKLKIHELSHIKKISKKYGGYKAACSQAGELEKHLLLVLTGATRFECSTCDFITFYKDSYEKHSQTHPGKILHRCNDCDYYRLSDRLTNAFIKTQRLWRVHVSRV